MKVKKIVGYGGHMLMGLLIAYKYVGPAAIFTFLILIEFFGMALVFDWILR